MVKNAISDYSSTAASNTDVGGVNIDEGMSPSGVNNAIRELMSHLADLNAGSSSLGTIKVDNLQLDGNAITSTDTNGNIALTPNGTGSVVIDGINYPQADGTADYFLKTNGSAQLSFAQVDTASIAADAVDGTKIADDSIDSEHYVDGSIDAAHIADNAVGATQLNVSGNGTSGQFLSSDGDGTFSWADAGGGLKLLESIDTETSVTWNKNADANLIRGFMTGASGGGGASGTSTDDASGGGGGSGGIWFEIAPSDVTNSVAVTIGAKGTGAASARAAGNAGGTTSFGSYITINGGAGGNFALGTANPTATTMAAGGTVSTNFSAGGNVNYLASTSGGNGAFQNDTGNNNQVVANAGNLINAGFKGEGGAAFSFGSIGYYGEYTNPNPSGGVFLFSSQNISQNGGAGANNNGNNGSDGRLIIEQYGAI